MTARIRISALGLSLLTLAGCASGPRTFTQMPAPVAVAPPPQTPMPVPSKPEPTDTPCFNTDYKFTCNVPKGFVITQEMPGPGPIMTLVQQSYLSKRAANMTLKAGPLGGLSLEEYMDRKVAKQFEGAKGVLTIEQSTAAYGDKNGVLVTVERQYASGKFKSLLFGFSQRRNVFILDYSAPAEQVEGAPTMSYFIESIKFEDAPL